MSIEWKPGDVVAVGETPTVRAMRTKRKYDDGEEWRFDDGTAWDGAGPLHPLAVLDPEDRDQVERLMAEFAKADGHIVARMQTALRSLLEPPKVFAHYPVQQRVTSSGLNKAMCGKTWDAHRDPKDCERCPECTAIVEAGWIA